MSTVITLPNLDVTTFTLPADTVVYPGSLQLDAVDDRIDLGDNLDFQSASPFTWSFYINPSAISAQKCLISKTTNDANVYGVGIYHNAAGKLFVQMRSSAALRNVTFGDTLTAGSWQHVVITYSGSQNVSGLNAYINATLDSASPPASNTQAGDLTTSTSLYFGRRGTSFHYGGYMAQVTRWDKALSAAEVTELYNSGTVIDPNTHSASANLVGWWQLSDPTNYPTEEDQVGSVDGTLQGYVDDSGYVGTGP